MEADTVAVVLTADKQQLLTLSYFMKSCYNVTKIFNKENIIIYKLVNLIINLAELFSKCILNLHQQALHLPIF